jgi:hypothetical protein
MQNAVKSLENNALAALTQRAPQGVMNAIKQASSKTGVSFSYLMGKAAAESNFDPAAKAKTSSATGLFQFIDSTWIDMMNRHGEKHGINTDQSKQNLLNLRKDPEIASVMAAEFAADNKSHLEKTVGGNIGETELYFAHFMGAGGASAFLSQLKQNPDELAAHIFPKEARANRNVFYDRSTGQEKTLQQVYNFFDKKFSSDSVETSVTENQIASKSEKSGYQHIPFSLKKPVEILPLRSNDTTTNMMRAFFSPTSNDRATTTNSLFSGMPNGFYSQLSDPTSMMLSLLRDVK